MTAKKKTCDAGVLPIEGELRECGLIRSGGASRYCQAHHVLFEHRVRLFGHFPSLSEPRLNVIQT